MAFILNLQLSQKVLVSGCLEDKQYPRMGVELALQEDSLFHKKWKTLEEEVGVMGNYVTFNTSWDLYSRWDHTFFPG